MSVVLTHIQSALSPVVLELLYHISLFPLSGGASISRTSDFNDLRQSFTFTVPL